MKALEKVSSQSERASNLHSGFERMVFLLIYLEFLHNDQNGRAYGMSSENRGQSCGI